MNASQPNGSQAVPGADAPGPRGQLLLTALLVLIAIGGAGLATAADRPAAGGGRPELTWRAEREARPMLLAVRAQLTALDEELDALAAAGRDALVGLRALEPDRISGAVLSGDGSNARLAAAAEDLARLRREGAVRVADRRLGATSRAFLADVDQVIGATGNVPAAWGELAYHAGQAAALLGALERHDSHVFRATAAGRQARYAEALDLLGQAELALADAEAVRDGLGAGTALETLDELLRRYREYDAALAALYAALAGGAEQGSEQARQLVATVERTQAALPASNDALRVVVAETAGPAAAEGLARIEQARGAATRALAGGGETR